MARVISDKPVDAFEITCSGCHYKLEFCVVDIHRWCDPDDGDKYEYVTCPRQECRRNIDLLEIKKNLETFSYDFI